MNATDATSATAASRHTQSNDYMTAYRVRTGRQQSIRVPLDVLASVLEAEDRADGGLHQYLGPKVVTAVSEAARRLA